LEVAHQCSGPMLHEKGVLGGTCLALECCLGPRSRLLEAVGGWLCGKRVLWGACLTLNRHGGPRSQLRSAVGGWLPEGTIEQGVAAEAYAAEQLLEEDGLVLCASAGT